MKKIILIGAGGFAREVLSIINNDTFEVIGFIDSKKHSSKTPPNKIIGDDTILNDFFLEKKCKYAFVCIGEISKRFKIFELINKIGYETPKIIHNNTFISKDVEIGEGTVIYPGAVIMSGTKIGKGVLINSNVSIGHDSNIKDFCNINPGVNIAGNVSIGYKTMIGIGTSIKENVSIGNNVVVGGASMVIKNISSKTLNYGVPSKPINRRTE